MKKYYFAMAGINCSHSKMFCKPFDRLYKAKEAIKQIMQDEYYRTFSIERHSYTSDYATGGETTVVLQVTR